MALGGHHTNNWCNAGIKAPGAISQHTSQQSDYNKCPDNTHSPVMLKMLFNGGGGVMVAAVLVCGALLAAAQPRLHQLVEDIDDSTDPMFQCFVRYMRTARERDVLLLHNNRTDATRYMANVRSPFTLITMPYLKVPKSLKNYVERPYGLVVLLATMSYELRQFGNMIEYIAGLRRNIKILTVVMAPASDAMVRDIFALPYVSYTANLAALTGNDARVFTYFPFGGGACSQKRRRIPEVLGQCQELHLDQLFPPKDPGQFNGCGVSIAVRYLPPAVIDAGSTSVQPLVAGYQLALANLIFRRLNLTRDPRRGALFVQSCASAHSYYTDTLRWYVPVAGSRAQWKGLVLLFSVPLWFAILAFFVFNTLVWWVAGVGGFVHCVLGSLVTLLNGAESLPERTHRRFLVVAWTLCGLVLVTAYQSELLSTLLTPVPGEQPITNEQELLASDMPVDYRVATKEIAKTPNYKDISAHAQKFGAAPGKPQAVLQYDLTARYRAREQAGVQYAFAEPAAYVPQCLPLNQRSAFMAPINRQMVRLVENGIIDRFMRAVDFRGYVGAGASEDEPLTLGHLGFAFIVLLMGCALALVVFLLEVVGWQLQHLCALCACTASIQRWRRRAQFRRRRRAFHARVLAQMNHQ